MSEHSKKSDIGIIGLAVMGRNLALNILDNGFSVSVWNYETGWVDDFVNSEGAGKALVGNHTLEDFVASIERPRMILMMIRSGAPVDQVIEQLIPLLDRGDIIIDGGNSNYRDTIRRTQKVETKGMRYVGSGVSGGEEGARHGPSLMPGGTPGTWPHIQPIFEAIAARAKDGTICCDWVGQDGAGHFVKMVHNGIEYGDMQLIGETYHLMKEGAGMSNDEMSAVFDAWNKGKLESYLIEITADILGYRNEDGDAVVDLILDSAGQKGTGKWTAITALELGIPLTLIGEAVSARFLSTLLAERANASKSFDGPRMDGASEIRENLPQIRDALYAAKIVSYTQGYMLFRAAAEEYDWDLNYGGIAQIWRGGCIIRSAFLGKIKEAYADDPELPNLLLAPYFRDAMKASIPALRKVVTVAVSLGIPVPALSSALAFFDGYRNVRLPANLVQAQRDYFGAHTYERLDKPRGLHFHTVWTGEGGEVTSGSYDA